VRMRSQFQRVIWLGFASAILIIAWLAITSYQNKKVTENAARWVSHTNEVLYHAEQILSLTIDLESGQRGYSLTGIEEFLEPTLSASRLLDSHIQSLKNLTSDRESQQDRIDDVEKLINEKVDFTMRAIAARRNEGFESAQLMNASLVGKRITDKIRTVIGAIQEEENQLLVERKHAVEDKIGTFNKYFVGMLFATSVILLLLFYFIHISFSARAKAQASLGLALNTIQDIYNNAPCGYHSLDMEGKIIEINNTWLQWLHYNRDEVIDKMNFEQLLTPESAEKFKVNFSFFKNEGYVRDEEFTALRKDGSTFDILVNATAIYDEEKHYVKSRATVLDFTEQKKSLQRIEQLNHELESFSYSVSHDLRAPLRSIDGYTQILIEDYSHHLDAEGKRVLQVVVNNTRRMAKLIDDLLDFSRVGRKEITKTLINTDSLVQSVVSELKNQEGSRKIEMDIGELQTSHGDPNLLRQVWVNLVSNALKYTRKQDTAQIEITSSILPGEMMFCVKDNGTGFDMQYASKLFGVFQRLHRQNDFEGTGVGLAIVHRIVSRHGGRVWAEAEVGKGAAFYFTLPH
jgi:PAS domain S-box-containing protein